MEHTQIDEWLIGKIEQIISGSTLANGELIKYNENATISQGAVDIINSFVSSAIKKSVDNIAHYVAVNLATYIIQIGSLLFLFIVSRILLLFLRLFADIIASLPIIKKINKTGGLVYGLLKAILITYSILAVFSILSPILSNWGLLDAIQDSRIGKTMYNDNIVLNVVFKT